MVTFYHVGGHLFPTSPVSVFKTVFSRDIPYLQLRVSDRLYISAPCEPMRHFRTYHKQDISQHPQKSVFIKMTNREKTAGV